VRRKRHVELANGGVLAYMLARTAACLSSESPLDERRPRQGGLFVFGAWFSPRAKTFEIETANQPGAPQRSGLDRTVSNQLVKLR